MVAVCSAAEHGSGRGSGLSGVVRDERGVPQMGALIELIGVGQSGARTAVTGLDGRFSFANLMAGTYRLHASGEFLRPVSTRGVRVASGVQAVVNLTLGSVYDAGAWLPAERRRPDEPDDDWMWTMRSGASRPVLRVADAGTAPRVESSSQATTMPLLVAISSRSGGFGGLGMAESMTTGYRSQDGAQQVSGVAELGRPSGAEGEGSLHLQASVARQSSPWSRVSTMVGYEANPEIQPVARTSPGQRFLRIGSAETATLGDFAEFQVGGVVESDGMRGGLVSRPFGRLRVHLEGQWSVEYAAATDRSMQDASDAGAHDPSSSTQQAGRVEHGRHDALLLSRQGSARRLLVSYYREDLDRTPVTGSGGSGASLAAALGELGLSNDALVDTSDGVFRAEGSGYRSQGCQVRFSQVWAPEEQIEVSFRSGSALAFTPVTGSVPAASTRIRVGRGVSAGVSAHSRIRRTATDLETSYQWQPQQFLTAVDAFDAVDHPMYLGFILRQRVPGRLATHGAVLSISATNLLRQGLRPLALPDQSVVTLAQELPVLQAGLGFSF